MHAGQKPFLKDWPSTYWWTSALAPFNGLLVSLLCTEEFLWKRVQHMVESCKHQPCLPCAAPSHSYLSREPFLALMMLVRVTGDVSNYPDDLRPQESSALLT